MPLTAGGVADGILGLRLSPRERGAGGEEEEDPETAAPPEDAAVAARKAERLRKRRTHAAALRVASALKFSPPAHVVDAAHLPGRPILWGHSLGSLISSCYLASSNRPWGDANQPADKRALGQILYSPVGYLPVKLAWAQLSEVLAAQKKLKKTHGHAYPAVLSGNTVNADVLRARNFKPDCQTTTLIKGSEEGGGGTLDAYCKKMAESYGDFGLLPPKLDHVGRKLTRGWLRKILLHGHGAVRPYLATRMPHYDIPTSEVEAFLDHLEQADLRNPPLSIDVSGLLGHQRGHYGRDLIGENGLNCITCHGLKEKRPRGAPSIDLTHTVTRLRPAYFKELLLDPQSVQPGTLMPPLFLNRPKAEQEVEQLWTYLKELDQRRLPDGLLNRGDFELKPSESGRPIILRTFMEHVGTHAIAVGYPEGTHFAFDAYSARWSLVWKGRFLDALSTWDDRYATPARPLGQELYRFPIQKSGREFLGYRLRNDGIPVFRYRENGTEIEDWVEIRPGGAIRRGLRRNGKVQHQNLQLEDEQALFRDAVKN